MPGCRNRGKILARPRARSNRAHSRQLAEAAVTVQGKHHKLGRKRRNRRSSNPSNNPNYWDNRVNPLAIGASAGLAVGAAADLNNARIGEDFIDDVNKMLVPNRVAVVAEIEEDWTTPVDTRMEAIGGSVFRRALSEVKHSIHEENVAAMNADLAQMKAEHAKAHAYRKAKLQEKINQLDSKIQAQLQKAKDVRETAERQAQAKVRVLESKAAAAKSKAS